LPPGQRVNLIGFSGGGTLALFRRVRSLIFATIGLGMYPRDAVVTAPAADAP